MLKPNIITYTIDDDNCLSFHLGFATIFDQTLSIKYKNKYFNKNPSFYDYTMTRLHRVRIERKCPYKKN